MDTLTKLVELAVMGTTVAIFALMMIAELQGTPRSGNQRRKLG